MKQSARSIEGNNSTLFQQRLLKWFDQFGRKHLPWQHNKTPYRVWISEVMLQQTQVSTVIPYFEKFMQRFPDINSLANANEDEVLHLWTGLGYYSRARHLHRAANLIIATHKGIFPHTLASLQQLPGIGLSTAGAILAIAFNQPATILDGNVKRVLTRFYGIHDPINIKSVENRLWQLATSLTPIKRVADYTQAMMDLGATLCTRTKPQCLSCPLHQTCESFRQNTTDLLPVKKPRPDLPIRQSTFLIFKKNEFVWLQKRPANGIWGSLFCLPDIPHQATDKQIIEYCKEKFQISLKKYEALPSFKHSFTHFHLEIFPILINLGNSKNIKFSSARKKINESKQIWYRLTKPNSVGLPKPILSILESLSWPQ